MMKFFIVLTANFFNVWAFDDEWQGIPNDSTRIMLGSVICLLGNLACLLGCLRWVSQLALNYNSVKNHQLLTLEFSTEFKFKTS